MFVMMVISLYSSRIVLQTLGSSDYGLYSVVGGFVALFFFISNSLSVATERFMAYAIGQNNKELRQKVFSLSVFSYLLLSVFILLIGLFIGYLFIQYRLNVPSERRNVALLVFVISLVTAIISFLRIPYNAAIIAYEKMGFYSWVSIIEALLKLLVIYLLLIVTSDKLVSYAFFQMLATMLISILFVIFCRINFNDFKLYGWYNGELLRKMGTFAGWNLYGGLADLFILQGLTILFNQFFGTIVNAAQALANQIKSQIASFVNNINIASGPAFTKYFAEGDLESECKLLFSISKMNYYILLLISLPIIFVLPSILNIWLGYGNYPEKTVIFSQLVLINTLIDTMPGAAQSVVFSSGKNKKYQFVTSAFKYLSFLFIYLLFELGCPAEYGYYALICFALPRIVFQINYCCRLLAISSIEFLRNVIYKEVIVTTVSVFFASLLIIVGGVFFKHHIIIDIIESIMILLFVLSAVFYVGIEQQERVTLFGLIKRKILNHKT